MKKLSIIGMIGVLAVIIFVVGCSHQQAPSHGVEMEITPEEVTAPADDAGDNMVNKGNMADDSMADDSGDMIDDSGDVMADNMKDSEKTDSGLIEITCDEKQTLGFIKCANVELKKAELTIRNTGRMDLDGVRLEYFEDGGYSYDSYDEKFSFPVGEDKVLDIPLMNSKLWKVEVFPVTGNDYCGNKQLVVIPLTNCR